MHDGRAIANFILDVCDEAGRPLTNLQLQKIVFFCHAWSLAERNEPLIRHSFEAWEYGPVLPYLYREFKNFDRAPIRGRARRLNLLTGATEIALPEIDTNAQFFLRTIVDYYSRIDAFDLVELSHVAGGPWHNVWNHLGDVNPGMKIDNVEIEKFYAGARRPFRS